ncbi:MAG: hypothetical protein ABF959_03910 [Gluconobacter albidus]
MRRIARRGKPTAAIRLRRCAMRLSVEQTLDRSNAESACQNDHPNGRSP